jgi:hypothetical protein
MTVPLPVISLEQSKHHSSAGIILFWKISSVHNYATIGLRT